MELLKKTFQSNQQIGSTLFEHNTKPKCTVNLAEVSLLRHCW